MEGSEAAQAAARGLTGDCQDMPSHAPRMSCYTGATSTTYATRLKFDEVLQKAGHNFVGENAGDATDPWPLVSFAATPYGNPALSERTLQSRNQYIRQVYRALGTTLPFVPRRPMTSSILPPTFRLTSHVSARLRGNVELVYRDTNYRKLSDT
eukprot:COSAG01_NODE_1044_length_11954_cov_5.725601_8_plen_153_part_00